MGEKPRQEFYAFTHQALPEVFFNDPQKFLTALNEHGEVFPRYIWQQMERLAKIESNSKAEEIIIEIVNLGEKTIYLITLPEPIYTTETYFIALVFNLEISIENIKYSFYTLEQVRNENGENTSMLCEWLDQDMHQNLTSGNKFSKEYFLEKVKEHLNNK